MLFHGFLFIYPLNLKAERRKVRTNGKKTKIRVSIGYANFANCLIEYIVLGCNEIV